MFRHSDFVEAQYLMYLGATDAAVYVLKFCTEKTEDSLKPSADRNGLEVIVSY